MESEQLEKEPPPRTTKNQRHLAAVPDLEPTAAGADHLSVPWYLDPDQSRPPWWSGCLDSVEERDRRDREAAQKLVDYIFSDNTDHPGGD